MKATFLSVKAGRGILNRREVVYKRYENIIQKSILYELITITTNTILQDSYHTRHTFYDTVLDDLSIIHYG